MWFASVCGRKDVICFKQIASRIVSDKWYKERNQDVGKDNVRIVQEAAKLLKADIRETVYDNETYPPCSAISDRTVAKQWIPPLVRTFLENLVTDEVKQIAFGHSIVQACRPRSVVSPVLLGVGISINLDKTSTF